MIKVVVLSAMFALFPYPASAGALLEVIHGTGARNGIMVLVQAGDAVCEDAAASGFAVLADDIGYGDIGVYGGKIPTPNIDRLRAKFLEHNDHNSETRKPRTTEAFRVTK